MPKTKYQRPEVYATGKREKLWKGEWREYYVDADGKQQSHHKSKTWARSEFTKAQAQEKLDAIVRGLAGEAPKADGSITLAQFYTEVYLPIRSRHWTGNTPRAAANLWRNHIGPKLGGMALKDISKAIIEIHLGRLADAGLGESMVDSARVRLHSILEEATENEYIAKNPARKVETPPCRMPEETRALTPTEAQALLAGTSGRDYMFWAILLNTGARIGEVLALTRDDLRPEGLLIDEARVNGVIKAPKRGKIRSADIPDSLRAEITAWLATHDSHLMFPSLRGHVYHRSAAEIEAILERGRAIVPGVTFRQCRTTFATLFEGEEVDRTSIMGHHSTEFTRDVYRKPVAERRKKAVEKLDRKLKVVPMKKRAG